MTNHVPNDPRGETDAAERAEPRPTPATGPWTGQGPIIANPAHSSQPYGAPPTTAAAPANRPAPSPRATPKPARPRWRLVLLVGLAVVAIVALVVIVALGL